MSELALRNLKFRRYIPAGFTLDEPNVAGAKEYFTGLVNELVKTPPLKKSLNILKNAFETSEAKL